MIQSKKLYVMALATFLFTFVGIIGTNSEIHASNSDQFVKSPVPEVIKKYVNSINNIRIGIVTLIYILLITG